LRYYFLNGLRNGIEYGFGIVAFNSIFKDGGGASGNIKSLVMESYYPSSNTALFFVCYFIKAVPSHPKQKQWMLM